MSVLVLLFFLLSSEFLAAQRTRRSAARGSVRYAGKTSSEGTHRTDTRRGTLETRTNVDGNKTTRQTSADGRYGRSAQGSSTVERKDDKIEYEREVTTNKGVTRNIEGEIEAGEGIEREATTRGRYGEEIEREQELERKSGYWEYEGKTKTSWGQEAKVEGVAGRDYWGRPVAYGTIDTKYRGDWGVVRGPYGGRMVTTLPNYYRPVNYYGRPYYTYGGLYYGRYHYGGSWIFFPSYPPYGVYYDDVPVGAITLLVAGATYYFAKSSYYQKTSSQGEVKYEVVEAPSGAKVDSLPAGTATITIANARYYYYNNTFYRKTQQGSQTSYVVVDRPPGLTIVGSLPTDFTPLPVEEVTFFLANNTYYLPYFDGKKEVYLVVDTPPRAAQMLASASQSSGVAPAPSNRLPLSRTTSSTLTAAAGTVLRVRLANDLSASRQQAGEPFTAYLDSNVIVDGRILAAKGGKVYGRVERSSPGIEMVLTLTEVSLNSRLVSLVSNKVLIDSTLAQALSTAAGVQLSTVLGGNMARQDAVSIPAQTVLTFQIEQPISISLEERF